jgi:hypothetical protein
MNTKTVLACTAVVIAFALIVAPLVVSEDAFAKNKLKQKISQKQSRSQSSTSVSGGDNILSGNNINLQGQFNGGSNTGGQSD